MRILRRTRRLAPGATLLSLALALICLPGAAGAAARPNVIVIVTDDQSVAELSEESMPKTLRLLGAEGTAFTRSFVSSPLCCPSRAGFLTGQYPHNNNVFDNTPGYPALAEKDSSLYSWLAASGYRTGHLGRFLLNYDQPAPLGETYDTSGGLEPPAGVEHWFGFVGSQTLYQGATFSRNGSPVTFGTGSAGYTTRVLNREALGFVREARTDPRPFYLTLAHLAPHSSNSTGPGPCGVGGLPIPDGGKLGPFKRAKLPKGPAFGESRIADKPDWVSSRPGLGSKRRRDLELGWRCANATLSTVDSGVAALVRRLKKQGELERTAIFLTSDNGYYFGEHRIVLEKLYPYDEGTMVPLLARVPERYLGETVRRRGRPPVIGELVNNLDLTATVLDLAGAAPCTAGGSCRTVDGRSLMPLLRGERERWPRGRGLLIELGAPACGRLPVVGLRNHYAAIRTKRHLYVELNRVNPDTGVCDRPEYELYDLRNDPNQLRNRAANPALAAPSAIQSALAARLAAMRACSGTGPPAGPPPPGACE